MAEQRNADRSTLASEVAPALTQSEIDARVFDLYDEYCHGRIDRREFLQRAGALTIGGVSALAMAQALLPRYALAQTISFTDQRIKARYVTYRRLAAPRAPCVCVGIWCSRMRRD